MAPLGDRAHATGRSTAISQRRPCSSKKPTWWRFARSPGCLRTTIFKPAISASPAGPLNCPSNSRFGARDRSTTSLSNPPVTTAASDRRGTAYLSNLWCSLADRNDVTIAVFGIPYGESAVEAALETASGIVWDNPTIRRRRGRSRWRQDHRLVRGAKLDHGRDIARSWPMSATRTIGGGSICRWARTMAALRAHRFGEKAADWFDGCPMPSPICCSPPPSEARICRRSPMSTARRAFKRSTRVAAAFGTFSGIRPRDRCTGLNEHVV